MHARFFFFNSKKHYLIIYSKLHQTIIYRGFCFAINIISKTLRAFQVVYVNCKWVHKTRFVKNIYSTYNNT